MYLKLDLGEDNLQPGYFAPRYLCQKSFRFLFDWSRREDDKVCRSAMQSSRRLYGHVRFGSGCRMFGKRMAEDVERHDDRMEEANVRLVLGGIA